MAPRRRSARLPRSVLRPMLATLIDAPFDDRAWVFETKWDGFRVIAHIDHGKVNLYSRGGKNLTKVYPGIAKALATIRHHAVIDGELVALDEKGRPSFQLLQEARKSPARLRYCVFDLMYLDGQDLRRLSLLERKAKLHRVLRGGPLVRFSRHVRRSGIRAFRAAARKRLEGVIAKRAESRYHSGRRTRDWLKIKTGKRQEVVIVGFTRPRRTRKYFGALALAVRKGGRWKYVGHTGTGFNAASLKSIYGRLRRHIATRKPVSGKVSNERATIWVHPRLVGEVKFTEWTKDGRMRHPAFIGLRTDKPASKVVREYEAHVRRR
jgi:bifunctional non-homologous end joining protein LigD